ncbi:NAD(P)/FAD-dependent oxidoreductase [Microbaculum marinum]|uniref:FAD-dependent oxidoreductase n=1 Tax=Microbaculum marinum TaxID=1764581 RepID=A0AAW9RLG9_9HYPH
MRRYEIAVVGAGMIGSSAALALAEAGMTVALIGPGEPADKSRHTGAYASHYDEGRITRVLDTDPIWADWAAKSIARYAEIEERSGIGFHTPCGAVRIAPTGAASLARARKTSERFDLELQEMSGEDLTRRCPAIRLPENFTVLWEPAPAGYVNPRRMVAALKTVARQSGAVLIEQEATSVRTTGEGVEVLTSDGEAIGCDRALVAVGPHARDARLLPLLPDLKPFGRTVVQIEVAAGDPAFHGMPSFIVAFDSDTANYGFYGVPPVPYPGGGYWIKAGTGGIGDQLDGSDTVRDWFHAGGSAEEARQIRDTMFRMFPSLADARWRTEPCALVETDTDRPLIGRVPGHEAIGIALGCCGFAAKSCIAVGKTAADMIASEDWAQSAEAGPLAPRWRD